MTRQDVAKMFYIVKSTYPKHFKGYSEQEIKYSIESWCMAFNDIDPEQGFAALKVYISTENTGFPPSPGQVRNCIHRLKPDGLPNEMAAWTLVDKAVRNAIYNADEEFEKLPQIIRRAVRNPARLREWAQMDVATYQTVEQSNFMRTYRAEVENERKNMRIPSDIRPQLEIIDDPIPMVEDKAEHERGRTPEEDIEAMIRRLEAV